MRNGIFKYVFIVFVIILVIITGVFFIKSEEDTKTENLDQISTSNVIQTDLRLAIAGFDTFNPILSNNKNVQEISKIVFEPLITLDSNLKIKYCLAKEIAKQSDTTYIIKLKNGIKFQDGTRLTASDVKFTIDNIKMNGSPVYSANLEKLQNLTAIDDTTISLELSEPVPFFEYNLTMPILSSKYFDGEDFVNSEKKNTAIGTGLFSIDGINNNVIKLVKNEDYWNEDKNPMVKEIYIYLYDAIGDVYDAFKSGDIDVLNVSTVDIDKYIGTLGHVKAEYKTRNFDFLGFNTQSDIFSDPQVRKALSLIIDKNALVATSIGQGYGASNFNFDMGSWLYSDMLSVPSNWDLAKQILLNAGWENKNNAWSKNFDGVIKNLEFVITVNANNSARIQAAENLKAQFENFGIVVDIKELNYEKYMEAINKKGYDVILAGVECGLSPNLNRFFGDGNMFNYSNQEIKEILAEVQNTNSENVIKEKYNRLYEIYIEEVPYFGLYRETDYVVYNQSVVGNIKPNVFNIFQNIEKWYRQ